MHNRLKEVLSGLVLARSWLNWQVIFTHKKQAFRDMRITLRASFMKVEEEEVISCTDQVRK